MKIIDAHAHIFNSIKGERQGHKIVSLGNGKVQFGEEVQQLLPVHFETNSFTAHDLVQLLDSCEVEKAVLLQNPVFGINNDEIAKAVNEFPERFRGTIQVDPLSAHAAKTIREFASEKQNTVKIEMSEGWGWSGKYPNLSLVSDKFMTLWSLISELGLRVIVDPGPVDNNGYQIENIAAIAREFPTTNLLIEHLGYLTEMKSKNQQYLGRWKTMIQLAESFQNIYIGFSAIPVLMNDRYPCTGSQALLKEVIDVISADKVIWGSDVPTTLNQFTYQQMIDVIRRESSFLTKEEMNRLLYDNAKTFFNF